MKTRNDDGDADAVKYGFPDPAAGEDQSHYYFVHTYRASYLPEKHADWVLTTTQYGSEVFISSIQKGNVFATQFHPEKSGRAGLELLRAWLSQPGTIDPSKERLLVDPQQVAIPAERDGLTKRIVACLDVRSNDDGDLVVTKGESYDVREKAEPAVKLRRLIPLLGRQQRRRNVQFVTSANRSTWPSATTLKERTK